jgi:copper chaperone
MHMSTIATYHVEGLTCSHCVAAVRQGIGALPGVCDVTVDLPTGEVTVRSERELTRQEISAAVDEAGYELAS